MPRFAFVLMCLLSACQSLKSGAEREESTPMSLLEAWRHSFLQRDAVAMTSCYEPSDSVVLMHSTGQVVTGVAAIRADYDAAFAATVFDDVSLDLGYMREAGDIAWVTGRLRMLTRPSVGDARWQLEINTTFVMRRSDGSWRIAHEQSTPVMGVPRIKER